MYKQLHIAALLSIVFVASSWALFRTDFFTFHDFTQGARIVEMARALEDAHFPAIWSENLGFGYGMPLFEFYAPLPYYVSGVFYLLGLDLLSAVKLLFIIPGFLTLVAGFLLGRKLYGSLGGVLVSASLVLAPYRAVNLFVRGALSEIWGISMIPLILLGGIKTIRSEKNGWVLLVLSITGLLLSHNLTALMFLPFSVVFLGGYMAWFYYSQKKSMTSFLCKGLHFFGYYFLSFIISSFYLIPAYIEKNYTRLESTILADYFDYNNHFLYIRQFFQDRWAYGGSTFGPQDDISFYLGFGQLAAVIIFIYFLLQFFLFIYKKKQVQTSVVLYLKSRSFTVITLSIILASTALLLTTQKTLWIWNSIELLKFLQFPWRFLSVAIVFLSIAIGGISVLARNKVIRYGITIVLLSLLLFNFTYFKPEKFISPAESQNYFYSDENKLRTDMSRTLPDYIPINITESVPSFIPTTDQFFYCQMTDSCKIQFELTKNKVNQKGFVVTAESETEVSLTIADYPGWTVYVNDDEIQHQTDTQGLISFRVPEGSSDVSVQLKNSVVRRYSNHLSALGITAFVILLVSYKKRASYINE